MGCVDDDGMGERGLRESRGIREYHGIRFYLTTLASSLNPAIATSVMFVVIGKSFARSRMLGGGGTWGYASKLACGSFSLHPRLSAGIASQFAGAGPGYHIGSSTWGGHLRSASSVGQHRSGQFRWIHIDGEHVWINMGWEFVNEISWTLHHRYRSPRTFVFAAKESRTRCQPIAWGGACPGPEGYRQAEPQVHGKPQHASEQVISTKPNGSPRTQGTGVRGEAGGGRETARWVAWMTMGWGNVGYRDDVASANNVGFGFTSPLSPHPSLLPLRPR
jgi:hypothetical protein